MEERKRKINHDSDGHEKEQEDRFRYEWITDT